MGFHYIWTNANPEYRERLREANEARAAVVYAAWKAAGRGIARLFRGLAEAARRARRAHKTYLELQALSDRQLADIGLSRGEIRDVAQTAADAPRDTRLTIAELRQARPLTAPTSAPRIARLPTPDEHRRKPAPWAARRPATRTPERERAAS